MSIGNIKTQGQRGSNIPFQLGVLQILDAINTGVIPAVPLATEMTLLQVLAAIQSTTEYEQNLVIDEGGVGRPTYLRVSIYNKNTGTFDPPIYYNAAGSVVVPVGPITIVNPQYVLDNILLEVTAINAGNDVVRSTRASELTLGILSDKFGSIGQQASIESAAVVLSTEQEAILSAIFTAVDLGATETTLLLTNALLTTIDADTSSIDSKLIDDYGAAAAALRTAAQIGNTAGQADFNVGAPTAQTLRVALANPDTGAPQVVTSVVASDSSGSPLAAGATSLGFTTDTLFVGTINGVAREASTFYGFEASTGKTLPEIAYTVTAGSMIIDKIV